MFIDELFEREQLEGFFTWSAVQSRQPPSIVVGVIIADDISRTMGSSTHLFTDSIGLRKLGSYILAVAWELSCWKRNFAGIAICFPSKRNKQCEAHKQRNVWSPERRTYTGQHPELLIKWSGRVTQQLGANISSTIGRYNRITGQESSLMKRDYLHLDATTERLKYLWEGKQKTWTRYT